MDPVAVPEAPQVRGKSYSREARKMHNKHWEPTYTAPKVVVWRVSMCFSEHQHLYTMPVHYTFPLGFYRLCP